MQNNYPTAEDKSVEQDDQAILDRATKRIGKWYTYYSQNITRGQEDIRFIYETQYTNEEIADLGRLGKKVAQFNKVHPLVQERISEYRSATPSLSVFPKNWHVPEEKIELFQSLLTSILEDSRAPIIYQTAFEQEITRGYSAACVYTYYDDKDVFNQNIGLMSFQFPECTFFDPTAPDATKSEGDYCGYYVFISLDAFKQQYPDVEITPPPIAPINSFIKWVTQEMVAICYYYEREYYDAKMYLIEGKEEEPDETIEENEYKERVENLKKLLEYADTEKLSLGINSPETIQRLIAAPSTLVKKTRTVKKSSIKAYKMVYNKILERTDWPIDILPLVYFDGSSYYIDGQQKTQSAIYHLRDPQRLHNYAVCEQLTGMAAARKEQFLMHKEHLTGDDKVDQAWRNPENQQGALLYSTPSNPRIPPTPTRLDPIPLNPAFLQVYELSNMSLQQIAGTQRGMDSVSPGGGMGVESGYAVVRKQIKDNLNHYTYVDNANRAIEQIAKIILELIPKIYDSPRIVTLKTSNNAAKTINLNERVSSFETRNNVTDLSGKLDVKIKLSAPTQLQKEMAINSLRQMVQTYPGMDKLVADLDASNIEIEQMAQLVRRIKKYYIPQNIIAEESGDPPQPPQPSPQEMLMQKELEQQDKKLQLQEMQIQLEAKKQMLEQQQAMVKAELEKQKIQSGAAQMVVDQFIAEKRANAEITKAEVDADMHALTTLTKLANAKKNSTVSG